MTASWRVGRSTVVAFLAVAALTVATSVGVRRIVVDQDDRLLEERADAVGNVLTTTLNGVQTSMRVLAGVWATGGDAPAIVSQLAAGLAVGPSAIAIATVTDRGGVVAAGAGPDIAPGALLAADRAAVVARAVETDGFVVDVLRDRREVPELILALPTSSGSGEGVFYAAPIDPAQVLASSQGTAFVGLRVAIYSSERAEPSEVVSSTQTSLPLGGRTTSTLVPLGVDRWLVVVGSTHPLVGSVADHVHWILLAAGIVGALLVGAVVEVLARRRSYAEALVEQRTRELSAEQATLGALVAASRDAIHVVDADGVVMMANPSVRDVLGVDPAAAPGRPLLGGEDGHDVVHEVLAHALAGDDATAPVRFSVQVDRGEGRVEAVVESQVAPLVDGAGSVTGAVIVSRDITARARLEAAEAAARTAAEEANRSKTEFLSRMSHELRTPLNAVLGFGQLLELDDLTADQRESTTQILRGGRHLLGLIDEVLDISRIEAGTLALSPEAVPVRELVERTADLVGPLAAQAGVTVTCELEEVERFVAADGQRARQVLLNLLSNAVKYNRRGGTVTVSTSSGGGVVRVEVTDTGTGIPPDRLARVFVPFDRLGAEATGVEGTGIGLTLAKRITEAMGGRIGVTSTVGVGSTFWIELAEVEGPVERFERLGNEVEPPAPVARSSERVVLSIEDNTSNLALVERIVAMRPGLRMVAAFDGRSGLDLARELSPALVLLDLHLPDMHGDEVLARLVADPATAGLPVVVVSADATPRQADRLLERGAAAYLTKPLDVRELLRAIDQFAVADPPTA